MQICCSSMAIESHYQLIADPEAHFVVIMKDGKIYKNTLKSSQ